MSRWLVTGGAGYIGAHVVAAVQESGHEAVVLDDFSTGLDRRLAADVPVIRGSVLDPSTVSSALVGVDGVIHLAAKKSVEESVADPLRYYRENVGGIVTLLHAMREAGVHRLVYSSSAAVYGSASTVPVTEATPLAPQSPYGSTKAIGEAAARDCGLAWGLSWVSLRYFNVAGAASDALGDASVANLVPMVFRALDRGERPRVFGGDYPTGDGSCVRDYVHVVDLADAHVAAIGACEAGAGTAYNVGRGVGVSVLEMMSVISDVIGHDVDAEIVARRPGDPPASFASTGKIEAELGWRASRDLREMVASAWSTWPASP